MKPRVIASDSPARRFVASFAAILAGLLAVLTPLAEAVEVRFERVAENVYAHVGDIGARSVANEGLNANLGLVVTTAGAVLIDSGATFRSARDIHAAIRRVTEQPVRWVANTGGQDHRWLGNGYFEAQGAELIAHAAAVPDMRSRGGDQLAALHTLLGTAAEGTVPTLPKRLLQGSDTRLELGGTVFEFRHRGGGHTPGDLMVWLPQAQVAFAGDIVYVDRLLAVLPVSSTRAWLDAFAALEQWTPKVIVPGHGRVTELLQARSQARDYLQALRAHMKRAVDQGTDISEAVKSFDARPFLHLSNAAELNPGNASRTYLEVERE
jgi:glyoxylase-like metal-dependent hydrolase (beta-lactamase superfamily II)